MQNTEPINTPNDSTPGIAGFTRMDLLAIVGVLSLLAVLQVPLIGSTKTNARSVICRDHLRRLTVAWRLYALENRDELVGAANWVPPGSMGEVPNWTGGSWLTLNTPRDPNNWNHDLFTKKSPLWPYLNDENVWRCPADPSTTINNRQQTVPRVRSYSMNSWVGGPGWQSSGPHWRVIRKISEAIDPGPSKTWVILDEREDSINDGYFIVDMAGYPDTPSKWRIVDYPTDWHSDGAQLSFVDGHVENWVWRDARTRVKRKGRDLPLDVPSPNNVDVLRLQAAATSRTQ